MIGYSIHLSELNKAGDRKNIGVRLGSHCIKRGIPVSAVAKKLGVTRQTVYNWFAGVSEPRKELVVKIRSLYSV